MASTYTPLGVELQATGENAGTWGTKTNTNLQIIEQISGGYIAKSIAGGAQTTALAVSDGSTGAELSHRMIEFTGTITGNQIVTIPIDVQTFYFLRNSTSGAYTVQFKYASGSGDSFTFSATDKGDAVVFATANDGTNPDIDTLPRGTVTLAGTETLTNKSLTDPVLTGSSASAGSIIFKEDTDNGTNSATLKGPASTADVTITLPAETGTVLTTASSIANSNLANSSLTIGSTGIALGGSATTFTGLASITSTAVVTNDSGFRIRNNSDNTKIGAFSSASITAGQTRTLTFPDASGTIATQAYVNAQITAEDLDITTDDGNSIAIDLDSETLTLAGGTGIASTSTGNTATFAIDSTVATLTGSQTLTNKTIVLGNNTVSGALANGITATTQSASDNSTKVATTAYVDNQVIAGAVNEFSDNVFRVKDNSDATKKLAFECSGISGSTTRTMTVPNTDGTISTESFATAIAVALG